jgi:hypothetical protein
VPGMQGQGPEIFGRVEADAAHIHIRGSTMTWHGSTPSSR